MELLWNMADEDITQYNDLLATEVSTFFYLLEAYNKNLEIKKQAQDKNGRTNK